MNLNAYWRLLRFDKPVGILLLWYPTAWALWTANHGFPPIHLLCLFALGTVLMRAGGCVVNDIADRKFDREVSRTKLRPLTSGEISLSEALILLTLLLLGALLILIQLPWDCFYLAVISLVITLIYPFCKRFLNAPQMVLGLAFSMGIPMAYLASKVAFDGQFLLLFGLNFAWIIAYDTMYAMTDKADDLRIGVKSTALYFASYDRIIIALLLMTMHGLWLGLEAAGTWFYSLWSIAALVLFYQLKLINNREPADCFKAFSISVYYGLLMWLAMM